MDKFRIKNFLIIFTILFSFSFVFNDTSFARIEKRRSILPKLSKVVARGTVRLNITRNPKKEPVSILEIEGDFLDLDDYRFYVMEHLGEKILVIDGYQKFSHRLRPDLPVITVKLPDGAERLSLMGDSTQSAMIGPTKIIMDYVKSKEFEYVGLGNSDLFINQVLANQVKLVTRKPNPKDVKQKSTSADIEIRHLRSIDLDLTLEGSSNLTLGGKVERLNVVSQQRTAVDISAEKLIVEECTVDLNYKSTLKVVARQVISGKVLGSAAVLYQGNPQIKVLGKGMRSKLKKVKQWYQAF